MRAPPIMVGDRFGTRVVVKLIGKTRLHGSTRTNWLVRCDCGDERVVPGFCLRRTTTCKSCAWRGDHGTKPQRPEVREAIAEAAQAWPQLWRTDDDASIDACAELGAQLGGMLLDEIAAVLGVTRERARQIEEAALAKLRHDRIVREWGRPEERRAHLWDEIESHALLGAA